MKQLKEIFEDKDSNLNTLLFKNQQLQKWVEEGYFFMPNKIVRDKRISSSAFRIYCLLRMRLFQKNYCFPGRDTLAEELGASTRQVDRYINELKIAKYIEVKRQGQGRPNKYFLDD